MSTKCIYETTASMKTLFKTCPRCGIKFGVKETARSLVNTERHTEEFKEIQVGSYGSYRPVIAPRTSARAKPVSIYTEEYCHTYKCKNCDYEWAEVEFVERHREGRPFPSSRTPLKQSENNQT